MILWYNKSMANKITQLVNESGDNLYPLAGGMAADSIGTEMLKDGSVTSDKIDWTTIGNLAKYDIQMSDLISETSAIPTGTWTEIYRSTASPDNAGVIELVLARTTFNGNNSGDRGVVIRTTASDTAAIVTRPPAASGVSCRLSTSWAVTLSSASTIGVAVFQSSGGDLNATTSIRTVRLVPKN